MIIKSMSLLKGMQKAGLIQFHEQTGTKITGLYGGKSFVCCYVWDRCEGVPCTFEYKGECYELEYVSGCFMPYVKWVPRPKWMQKPGYSYFNEARP
jgi:hypothetical protein